MGIGGGFFMTVYIRAEEKSYSVNARERAPLKAYKDLYNGDSSKASKGNFNCLLINMYLCIYSNKVSKKNYTTQCKSQ